MNMRCGQPSRSTIGLAEMATKKAKVEGTNGSEEVMEQLQAIQEELDELGNKALEEIMEVEKKYNALKKPKFDVRGKAIENIPGFWATAIMNHPTLSSIVSDGDRQALQSLLNVAVEDEPDLRSGYTITMTFGPNAYFTNTTLSKSIKFDEEGTPSCESTPIDWKQGKNLTIHGGHQEVGSKRPVPEDSFFSLFDNEEVQAMPEIFKEELWSNPVKYYLGIYSDDENEDDEEDDEEDVDVDDEEDIS